MADYLVTDTELTSIADAIRTRADTSGQITFPNGFITAINSLPSRFIKGTFTTPDSGDTFTISLGDKSFDKYFFWIEMTEDSKTTLLQTNVSYARAFSFYGVSFLPECKGYAYNNNDGHIYYSVHRITPSTQAVGINATQASSTSSSLTLGLDSVTTELAKNILYRGYSYNYCIVEI